MKQLFCEAEHILADMVTRAREGLEDGRADEAGIFDDGYACHWCGVAAWDFYETAQKHAVTTDHDPDCIWRRAVELLEPVTES